jgi:hypothetical protein
VRTLRENPALIGFLDPSLLTRQCFRRALEEGGGGLYVESFCDVEELCRSKLRRFFDAIVCTVSPADGSVLRSGESLAALVALAAPTPVFAIIDGVDRRQAADAFGAGAWACATSQDCLDRVAECLDVLPAAVQTVPVAIEGRVAALGA